MSEALREMTYYDFISHLLSLTYRHECDIKDALYTPTPSCTFKAEEGET